MRTEVKTPARGELQGPASGGGGEERVLRLELAPAPVVGGLKIAGEHAVPTLKGMEEKNIKHYKENKSPTKDLLLPL